MFLFGVVGGEVVCDFAPSLVFLVLAGCFLWFFLSSDEKDAVGVVELFGHVLELKLVSYNYFNVFDSVQGYLFATAYYGAALDHEAVLRAVDQVVLGHDVGVVAFEYIWFSAFLAALQLDYLGVVAHGENELFLLALG